VRRSAPISSLTAVPPRRRVGAVRKPPTQLNFIWSVADEIPRDDFNRGKYSDVILPFTVLRRLDRVLQPTRDNVQARYAALQRKGLAHIDGQLRGAAGHSLYNVSLFDFPRLLKDSENMRVVIFERIERALNRAAS
jgi:type I restriction-modification system DNA methylase subunit